MSYLGCYKQYLTVINSNSRLEQYSVIETCNRDYAKPYLLNNKTGNITLLKSFQCYCNKLLILYFIKTLITNRYFINGSYAEV